MNHLFNKLSCPFELEYEDEYGDYGWETWETTDDEYIANCIDMYSYQIDKKGFLSTDLFEIVSDIGPYVHSMVLEYSNGK